MMAATADHLGRDLAVLLLLGGLSFFPFLGRQPVSRLQEVRVLETAREMGESGDLLVPRFHGEPRFEKPPLAYWLALGGFLLRGEPDEAGGRLYSAISGLLTVLVVYAFGRNLGRPRLGLWAGAILATSSLFYRASRRAETDVLMTLAITSAFYAFWRALGSAGTARGHARLWTVLAWSAMSVGFLAKGPAALLFPLLSISIYLAVARRWRDFARVFSPLGLLVFAVLAVPWFLEVMRRQGMALDVFLREMKVVTSGANHPEPNVLSALAYYLIQVWPQCAPWCILLPFAVVAAARRARTENGCGYLLAWVGGILLQLEVTWNKQRHYLVPAIPGLALLAAWWVHVEAPRHRLTAGRWFARSAAGLAVASLAVMLAWAFHQPNRWNKHKDVRDFAVAARPIVGDSPALFVSPNPADKPFIDFYFRRIVPSLEMRPELRLKEIAPPGRSLFLILYAPPGADPEAELRAATDWSIELVHAAAPPEPPLRLYRLTPTPVESGQPFR